MYKYVSMVENNLYPSQYSKDFVYEVGKTAVCQDVDEDTMVDCSRGLHCTSILKLNQFSGPVILEVMVNIKDIVSCLSDKVRCRKLKVLREIIGVTI